MPILWKAFLRNRFLIEVILANTKQGKSLIIPSAIKGVEKKKKFPSHQSTSLNNP
jgi:hypothetical protein